MMLGTLMAPFLLDWVKGVGRRVPNYLQFYETCCSDNGLLASRNAHLKMANLILLAEQPHIVKKFETEIPLGRPINFYMEYGDKQSIEDKLSAFTNLLMIHKAFPNAAALLLPL